MRGILAVDFILLSPDPLHQERELDLTAIHPNLIYKFV
jgi:hypothetical protein